jgi:hypothetical protein
MLSLLLLMSHLGGNSMMKFTLERQGVKVEYELSDESSISEVVDAFRSFLIAATYHPDTIDEYIVIEDNV